MRGECLRSRMHVGSELRQQFVKIHSHDRVIAEEIRTADRVVLARMVIHFPQGVFRTVFVWIVQRHACSLTVVGGIETKEVSAQGIHGDTVSRQISRSVRNTDRTIPRGNISAVVPASSTYGSRGRDIRSQCISYCVEL